MIEVSDIDNSRFTGIAKSRERNGREDESSDDCQKLVGGDAGKTLRGSSLHDLEQWRTEKLGHWNESI